MTLVLGTTKSSLVSLLIPILDLTPIKKSIKLFKRKKKREMREREPK